MDRPSLLHHHIRYVVGRCFGPRRPKHLSLQLKRKKLMTDRSRTGASARPRLGPARPAAPPRSPLLPGLSSTCSPTIHAWDTESAHAFYPPVCMCFYVPSPIHTNRYYFFIKLLKNILSALYYLCFKNRLHHCILHDEANKTRPLRVYVLRCFSLVATYM